MLSQIISHLDNIFALKCHDYFLNHWLTEIESNKLLTTNEIFSEIAAKLEQRIDFTNVALESANVSSRLILIKFLSWIKQSGLTLDQGSIL